MLYAGNDNGAFKETVSTKHPVVWIHAETGIPAVIINPMWLHHIEETGVPLTAEESQ